MRSVLVLVVVWMVFPASVSAQAESEDFYWRTSKNAIVHWAEARVRIPVDPELVKFYGPELKQALADAAAEWSVSPNIPLIEFDYAPTQSDRAAAREKRGNWLGLARTWDYGDELAITVSTSDASSGRVLSTQVWINARRPLSISGAPQSAFYDLQGVLTHELGHVLGLGEGPQHTEATMNPNFKRGEQHQRTVHMIDEQAVISLYEHVGSEPASSSASCSTLVGSATGGARAVWGGLFTLCALVRVLMRRRAGAGRLALA